MKKIYKITLLLLCCVCCCIVRSFAQSANMVAYEYWYDADFVNKVAVSVTPIPTLHLVDSLPIAVLPAGLHTLHFRAKDSNGQWTVPLNHIFYKAATNSGLYPALITEYEYWFDDSQTSTTIDVPDAAVVNISNAINVDSLPAGLHTFHFRAKDTKGQWSVPLKQFFYKAAPTSSGTALIGAYRYYFNDNHADLQSVTLPAPVNPLFLNTTINTLGLPVGQNVLHIQFQDINDLWSVPLSQTFEVICLQEIEICNGIDDDCDGAIDDDSDADGFTVCQNDCNDNNAQINPNIQEIYNLIDDDCDGLIDEVSNNEWTTALPISVRNYIFNASECANEFWATTQGATYSANPADNSVPHPICAVYNNNLPNMEDVWFKFTATNAIHVLRYLELSATTGVIKPLAVAIYRRNTNNPSKLVPLNSFCDKNFGSISTHKGELGFNGFAVGTEYFVRVWMDGTNNSGLFQFYVTTKPQNDDCAAAINVEDLCSPLVGTTRATRSDANNAAADCPGNTSQNTTYRKNSRNDDVWFKFEATAAAMSVEYSSLTATLGGAGAMGFDLFDNCTLANRQCSGYVSGGCHTFTGLTVGNEYLLRTYLFGNNNSGMFDMALTAGQCRGTNREVVENQLITEENTGVLLFPNPANDVLNVSVLAIPNKAARVQISDIHGKIISVQQYAAGEMPENWQIDLAGFNTGVYTLSLEVKGESKIAKRFVVIQ